MTGIKILDCPVQPFFEGLAVRNQKTPQQLILMQLLWGFNFGDDAGVWFQHRR